VAGGWSRRAIVRGQGTLSGAPLRYGAQPGSAGRLALVD
jgi:hypothetical protein